MSQHEETQGTSDEAAEPAVVATLRKVIQDRRLTKEFLETEEFRTILSGLRETTLKGNPLDVWSSLSIAGRAASVAKPMNNVFFPLVDERIDAGLPPFVSLHATPQ